MILPFAWGRAELLFSEDFDYTNGPLGTVSAEKWFYVSGTANTMEVASGRAMLDEAASEDMAANIPGGPFTSNTNVALYWSFRLTGTRLPSGTGYFAHLSSSSTFRSRVFVTTNSAAVGAFRVGIANGASTPSAIFLTDLAPHAEAVVLVMYNPATGASKLWINPTNENDTVVTATDSATTISISRIGLRQAANIGSSYVDDLRIGTNFSDVHALANPTAPTITLHPNSQTALEGQTVTFTGSAGGTEPIHYQWLFEGAPLDSATNTTLTLSGVQPNQSGFYSLAATNAGGLDVSDAAQLVVNAAPAWDGNLKVLTWNVKGNSANNWSVNAPQVQAIGRVLTWLSPDVITFNEIPRNYTWEMTNWVAAFLPGWYLATNSGTDNYIRTVIASRFEILSSTSHLDGVSLSPYGTGNFTRDLFQARVRVPGSPQPVDVFSTHLKATTSTPQADADRRAAEAMAISNFIANIYLATNNGASYVLTGDLNEDVFRPDTDRYETGFPIQNLANPQTGLVLTTPLNPFTTQDFTLSIQSTLNVRFDYVLPCAALDTNVAWSEVFRTDVLTNFALGGVLPTDSRTASDHLPVMMAFRIPGWPVRPLVVNGDYKLLSWETTPGEKYRILSTADLRMPLADWTVESANFTATSYLSSVTLVNTSACQFFKVERLQ